MVLAIPDYSAAALGDPLLRERLRTLTVDQPQLVGLAEARVSQPVSDHDRLALGR